MSGKVIDFEVARKREPHEFGPICDPFPYSNDEFGSVNLPIVRIASLLCSRDWREVEDNIRNMMAPNNEDLVFTLLDDMQAVRERMEAIVELIKVGEARICLTLRRIAPEIVEN